MKPRPIAIAHHDEEVAGNIRQCLIAAGEKGKDIEPRILRNAEEVIRWLETANPKLLVLHEELALGAGPDYSGHTARLLLESRRNCCNGLLIPTMVVTFFLYSAPDLRDYCTPSNEAIGLPEIYLKSENATIFRGILAMIAPNRHPTWTAIEIEIERDKCTCSLGDGSGKKVNWKAVNDDIALIRRLARNYDRQDPFLEPTWLDFFDTHGRMLFDLCVFGTLGKEMFEHIERAAGGLSNLAFRFKLSDTLSYGAPLEAIVRPVKEDDARSEFVLLYAPLVRLMPSTAPLKVAQRNWKLPNCVKILFIRSQMTEHQGVEPYEVDLLDLGEERQLKFRKLDNIDLEFAELRQMEARLAGRLKITKLDLSEHHSGGAIGLLRETMEKGKFDIVHFAGHSWSSSIDPTAKTILVLPGAEPYRASKINIEDFAALAGQKETRLVYLSSCQGAARAVLSLVSNGVLHAFGYRCNVADEKAAGFAMEFYKDLFEKRSICRAFRSACSQARQALDDDDPNPIWASPILVAQPDNWLR